MRSWRRRPPPRSPSRISGATAWRYPPWPSEAPHPALLPRPAYPLYATRVPQLAIHRGAPPCATWAACAISICHLLFRPTVGVAAALLCPSGEVMHIGVPREIVPGEKRVALVPE